jgi:hypothetical protein
MLLRFAFWLGVLCLLAPASGCGRVPSGLKGQGVEVRFALPEILERKQGRREKFLALATQARVGVFVVERGKEVRVCEHFVEIRAGSSPFLEGCHGRGRPSSVRAEVWEAGWKRKLAEGKARVLKEHLETQSTVLLKVALKVPVGEFDP